MRLPGTICLLIGCLAIAVSCGDNSGNNLPKSSGLTGDMYVVMDSVQWKGPLGRVVDSLFSADMEGLPRDEAIFNMKWIDPRKLNFILKQRRNLIFAMTLDSKEQGSVIVRRLFTPASLEKIKSEPGLYLETKTNLYAQGQEVMFLFGTTEQELIANVRKDGRSLVEYFNKKESERLEAALFKTGTLKGGTDWLEKNIGVTMKIPFGYKLVQNERSFLWARQINPSDDKDIFLAATNYTSVDQFNKENLIAFRDSLCNKYLYEDPDLPDSYLITETGIPFKPILTRQVNFDGHYAVEMKGLWRTNNKSMGGPFLAYAIADEKAGKFYYIEGFTFSPSKSQREIMRELETILMSFSLTVPSTDAKKQ